jgi:hypothetical protein
MIGGILGILTVLSGFGLWIYDYHNQYSTKTDNATVYIDVRIEDVQETVIYYTGKKNLDKYDRERLVKLKSTLEKLENQRKKMSGYIN